MVPAEAEHAGVAGVVQHPKHAVMVQRFPVQFAFVGSAAVPTREVELRVVERFDAAERRAGGGKRGKQVADRLLDGGIGVEHVTVGGVVDQPDG